LAPPNFVVNVAVPKGAAASPGLTAPDPDRRSVRIPRGVTAHAGRKVPDVNETAVEVGNAVAASSSRTIVSPLTGNAPPETSAKKMNRAPQGETNTISISGGREWERLLSVTRTSVIVPAGSTPLGTTIVDGNGVAVRVAPVPGKVRPAELVKVAPRTGTTLRSAARTAEIHGTRFILDNDDFGFPARQTIRFPR